MLSLRQRFRERWSRNEGDVSTNKNEFEQEESREILSKTASEETRNVEELPSEQLHFIVDFIGSSTISEAKSVQILSETLKRVKKQQLRIMRVDFTITDGILKVSCVESSALLLTAPLYAIALCAQEQLRGFDNCFALNITRRKTHMCHVFEAGSRLEVRSDVKIVSGGLFTKTALQTHKTPSQNVLKWLFKAVICVKKHTSKYSWRFSKYV